jgi:peptide/nickel transport system substrate-binding protein
MGAKVSVRIFETGDLNQNIIRPRKYDAILFGEIVGRDPDPFAFWHSSQRNDPGLNISMYANIKVDKLLEEARATVNDEKRKDKYEEFQKEVANDLPAIFLFSPKFVYLLPEDLRGLEKIESITVPSERFSQIYKWYFKTDKVWKIFAKQEN